MTQQQKLHLDFLDGIRGVAIGLIFLFHLLAAAFGEAHLDWTGLFLNFSESPEFLALLPLQLEGNGVLIFW